MLSAVVDAQLDVVIWEDAQARGHITSSTLITVSLSLSSSQRLAILSELALYRLATPKPSTTTETLLAITQSLTLCSREATPSNPVYNYPSISVHFFAQVAGANSYELPLLLIHLDIFFHGRFPPSLSYLSTALRRSSIYRPTSVY